MRSRLFVCILVLFSLAAESLPAYGQGINWIRQFGTARRDEATAIAKGPGLVYVTGNTIGVFPGQTAAGLNDTDVFVAAFDDTGTPLWTRQLGSAAVAFDTGTGAAADQTGVYVVGHTQGALAGQTSAGNEDAIILKYDTAGNLLWTRQFGTTSADQALAVATDGTGVYVVGYVEGDLITGAPRAPQADVFIRRYDANGTVVWTRQFGTVNADRAFGVATDSTGIYVAGNTGGALAAAVGGQDGFLRKYDSGGNEIWTRQFGTNNTDNVYAVAAGGLGVFVSGDTTVTFPGQTKIGGLYDAFLMKFDSSGAQQWVRQLGSTNDDAGFGVAVAATSVVLVGSAGESIGGQPYTGAAFIQLYDGNGALQSTIQFGNGSNDASYGVAGDATGAYVGGVKTGNALGQTPLGDFDAFALKIDPPVPTSVPFTIANMTAVSTSTDGSGGLSVGYARIDTASGTTPSGVAIFGYRPAGVLVTEAGVPDAPLITSGRTYGEVNATGTVNTGLAIANPNDVTVTVSFTLTDTAGTVLRGGNLTIEPHGQVAGFLNEPPYSSGNGFQGTLSFTSTAPIGVIALRSFVNERSDFLVTTLPVIDLSRGASTGTQVIPHFAVGDGWSTQILLINATDTAQTGTVQFLGPGSGNTAGAPVNVNIEGTAGNSVAYSVAARSSRRLTVSAASAGLTTGSVRVVPTGAGPAPTPLVIFAFRPGEFTVSEAGVPVTMGTAFRMYVEASAAPSIETGFAIANTGSTAATVTLQLVTMNGAPVATSPPQTLPASGQLVGFLSNFFPTLAKPFQGILRISTSATISVVALRSRTNERGDFLITTTPPTVETSTPTNAVRVIPHFVNGDGWITQFILFSGTTGQTSSGNLRFLRQNGTPLPVGLR